MPTPNKKIINKIIGVKILDKNSPNLNHTKFGQKSSFGFINEMNTKQIEIAKKTNRFKLKLLSLYKKKTAIRKKITENVNPKFFSDGVIFFIY